MCGRFSLDSPAHVIAEVFGCDVLPDLVPRYNVAPTQQVLGVVREEGERRMRRYRWGLVPTWARDLKVGHKMINARSETAAGKPAFRRAMKDRRLLVPVSGFYEWKRVGKLKQPIHFRRRDGLPYALAGLWETWDGPDGLVTSCTVLTTAANPLVAPLHDRMPLILHPEAWDRWLDRDQRDPAALSDLLVPWPHDDLEAVPVSTRVNNARNEGPECLGPPEEPLQG